MLVTSVAYRVKKLICPCMGKRLSMIMYPQIHKPLCCHLVYSTKTMHEWSKSSVETVLHVAGIQFRTQA